MVNAVECVDKDLVLQVNANLRFKNMFWTENVVFKNTQIRLFSSKGNNPCKGT